MKRTKNVSKQAIIQYRISNKLSQGELDARCRHNSTTRIK